jgi:6-phosphogluconolactonase
MSRRVAPDAEAAAREAARHLLALAPRTLAVSGGGAPKMLFDELARSGRDWSGVHLFWVDERAVPPDDPGSNYRLAEEHLIGPAGIPRANVHRIQGELPPERAAARYADELREFFGGEPRFDAVQLGMGTDGHTASLFPGSPLIADRDRVAAAVYAPKKPNWRVTLLPRSLLTASHTIFLLAGGDKAPALRSVFRDEYDPARLPAQLIAREGRDVAWFLDEAAAGLLGA